MEKKRVGQRSIQFLKPPHVAASASVVGKKEGEGCFKDYFDKVSQDDYFGTQSWEDAESTLQKEAVTLALSKGEINKENIHYILSGDLLGQSIASSFGLKSFIRMSLIPFIPIKPYDAKSFVLS